MESVLPQGPTVEHGNSDPVSDSRNSLVTTCPDPAIHDNATNSLQDSAYLSAEGHSTESAVPTNVSVRRVPGSHLLIFRKAGDANITKRYQSIQPVIELWLIDAITSSKHNLENLSIALEMVGSNEQNAKPTLIVFCARKVETTVSNFFASNRIQSQLRLVNDGTTPLLEYIIVPFPPKFVSNTSRISVFAQTSHINRYDTFCGAPLLFARKHSKEDPEQFGSATCGGIIKVEFGYQRTKYLGITAGHVQNKHRHEEGRTCSKVLPHNLSGSNDLCLLSWLPEESVIGEMVSPDALNGTSAGQATPNYDWALFDVKKTLPNLEPKAVARLHPQTQPIQDAHTILKAEKPRFQDGISDPVLLLGATAGVCRGELCEVPARIWLVGSQQFVNTIILQLEEGTVSAGDSGAWVVHSAAPFFYGHVAATNAHGDAYVMPAIETFENIRDCLGAISVTLPDANDLGQVFTDNCTRDQDPTSPQDVSCLECHNIANNSLVSNMQNGPPLLNLHYPKVWDSIFSSRPETYDRIVSDMEYFKDNPLQHFLNNTDPQPNWSSEVIRTFCNSLKHTEQAITGTVKARDENYASIDLWTRNNDGKTKSRKVLTELSDRDLETHLNMKGPAEHHNFIESEERRIIYISGLTPDFILTLARTVYWSQTKPLKQALAEHIAKKNSLKVEIAHFGFKHFSLHLSLPSLHLREVHVPESDGPALWSRFPDQFSASPNPHRYAIYSGHISIVLCGTSHSRWTAYAFETERLDEDVNEDSVSEDSPSDDDEEEEEEEEEVFVDPLFGSYAGFGVQPECDPRIYFLHVLRYRSEAVVRELGLLIYTLEDMINDWFATLTKMKTCENPRPALSVIIELNTLVLRLRKHLAGLQRCWLQFLEAGGDAVYFSDLKAYGAASNLNSLKGCVSKAMDFEKCLCSMQSSCVEAIRVIELQLNSESEKRSRKTYRTNLTTNSISNDEQRLQRKSRQADVGGAKSAAKSAQEAHRSNVRLLLITMPLALALNYYDAKRPIFPSVERNNQNFIISLYVLCLAVYLLGPIIRLLDSAQKAFFARCMKLWSFASHRDSESDESELPPCSEKG